MSGRYNNEPSMGVVTRDAPRVLRPATDWVQQFNYFGASALGAALVGRWALVQLDPQKSRRTFYPAISFGAAASGFFRGDVVFAESGQVRCRFPFETLYGGGASDGVYTILDSQSPGDLPPITVRFTAATSGRAVAAWPVNVAADEAWIEIRSAAGTFANFHLFLAVMSQNE